MPLFVVLTPLEMSLNGLALLKCSSLEGILCEMSRFEVSLQQLSVTELSGSLHKFESFKKFWVELSACFSAFLVELSWFKVSLNKLSQFKKARDEKTGDLISKIHFVEQFWVRSNAYRVPLTEKQNNLIVNFN